MWQSLAEWPPFVFVKEHDLLFGWLAFASVLMFVASLVVVPLLLARMPEDFFVRPQKQPHRRTPLAWAVLILKNVVGVVLLLAGVAMLLLPGQGVISILAGLSLMNFPGKRRLELMIISRPTIYRSVNWLRAKAGGLPLRLPKSAERAN